jgi:hypothetical protein
MTTVLNGVVIWYLAGLIVILPLLINAAQHERQERKERREAPQAQVIQFPSTKDRP